MQMSQKQKLQIGMYIEFRPLYLAHLVGIGNGNFDFYCKYVPNTDFYVITLSDRHKNNVLFIKR